MDQKTKMDFEDEEAIRSALLQFGIFLLFVLTTTMVALASRHLYMFHFNHAIFDRLSVLERYVTVAEWWNYLLESVIPQLHVTAVTNATATRDDTNNTTDTNTAFNKSDRMLLDENLMLGPPRLRQMRVVGQPCVGPAVFTAGLQHCFPAYSRWHEDTSDMYQGTRYYTKSELDATTIHGLVNDYVGGGYMESLSFDRNESQAVVLELSGTDWVDRGTRIVLMEFTLYNEKTDLFNNVKLLAEVLPTGGAIISGQEGVFKLYGLWTNDWFVLLSAVIFYVMVIYYTILEVREIRGVGFKHYIKSAWNIVDMVILSMGFLSFIYNLWHPIHLTKVLRRAEDNPNEYQSLDTISYVELLYLNGMAICTFLVWIKVLKYINFTKTTIQLRITFNKCYKDVLGFSVFFMCIIFAYAWWGFLLFGSEHRDFKTFPIAFWSVMRMVLCDFDYEGVEQANRVLGPIYFLTFVLAVFFVVVNMFLAIISDTFNAAKEEVGHAPNPVAAFLRKHCNHFKDELDKLLIKAKLKSKPDVNNILDSVLQEIVSEREPQLPAPAPPEQPEKVRLARSLILREFFEAIRSKEDAEQLDRLEQHVSALEEIFNKASGDFEYFERKSRAQAASPPSPPLPGSQPLASQTGQPTKPETRTRSRFKRQPLYVVKPKKGPNKK